MSNLKKGDIVQRKSDGLKMRVTEIFKEGKEGEQLKCIPISGNEKVQFLFEKELEKDDDKT